MTRVGLVSSEPIRPAMGGIGIRYLELARGLSARGFDLQVLSPAEPAESAAAGLHAVEVELYGPEPLARLLSTVDAVVAQGQLANEVVLAEPEVPVIVDLYDPWMIENLHYAPELGYEPFRNDHASWVLQLSRADGFLCASREQRLFYLGFLAALGRVNPRSLAQDGGIGQRLMEVPFGAPARQDPLGGILPPRREAEIRIFFGGVYDWYDIETFVAALERLEGLDWTAWVVRHPRPEATPQEKYRELERACRARRWWGSRVQAIDWVAADRRCDLLGDVDLLASPHLPGLESELAFRTRFLDALAAGCPAVATAGGAVSRMLSERDAGWVVAPRDADALAAAIRDVSTGGAHVTERVARGRELASELTWDRVVEPLVAFLGAPLRDPARGDDLLAASDRRLPAEPALDRIRRRVRRMARGRRS